MIRSRSTAALLGYDILSFDAEGHERYIEVKPQSSGLKHPSTYPPQNWISHNATKTTTPYTACTTYLASPGSSFWKATSSSRWT
jgi:hypothetical protein